MTEAEIRELISQNHRATLEAIEKNGRYTNLTPFEEELARLLAELKKLESNE